MASLSRFPGFGSPDGLYAIGGSFRGLLLGFPKSRCLLAPKDNHVRVCVCRVQLFEPI